MGIPAYFSHLIRNYKNIVAKLIGSNIDFHNMYMDCNSIIYDCVHKLNSKGIIQNFENDRTKGKQFQIIRLQYCGN